VTDAQLHWSPSARTVSGDFRLPDRAGAFETGDWAMNPQITQIQKNGINVVHSQSAI
jgi:hypothetical protein